MELIFPKIKVPVLQNRVFETQQSAVDSDYGFIELAKNKESGIFENVLFDSKKLIYDSNYDNEQSNSIVFQNHLKEVSSILFPYMGNRKIVEVGCGKGYFLELLVAHGIDAYGCDPTYTGKSERVVREFFSEKLGLTGDLIILRHVLEHIQNPVDFLYRIAAANGNKGLIYIEVPDFNWIIKNQAFFDVFYEHVNYFRPKDFQNTFSNILDQGLLFGDQYQYVIADLSSIQLPPYKIEQSSNDDIIEFESLNTLVKKLKSTSSPIYIWGAASKGVILAMHLIKAGIPIQNLIDINPNKQSKFTALTGIQIISPEQFCSIGAGSTLIIVNPNYEAEIKGVTSLLEQVSYIVL
jgi:hypothetical protein